MTTIDAERTFWDKVVIAHGLRNWFDKRGALKQDGQRISRHYYDLHCMFGSEEGKAALVDLKLGKDCIAHARTFFNRPDYNLASAISGTFSLLPEGEMAERLAFDYENTKAMIFGQAPEFETIIASVKSIEEMLNLPSRQKP